MPSRHVLQQRRLTRLCQQLQCGIPMLEGSAAAQMRPQGRQPDESSHGERGVGEYLLEPVRFRQLFLDDYGIESWDGCTKNLHQPKLCGACIGPHEGHAAPQSRNAPCYNPETKRWEWWYMGGMATSLDGEVWQVSNEPTAAIRSLIRDDNEPDPAKRYKALLDGYRDENDGGNVSGLTPATSPTGLGDTWTKAGPVVPSSDESSFSYDPWTEHFIATVKQGTEWGRSVWVSTAPATDFGAFTEPELIFHADEQDKINRQERVKRILENPEYLSPAIVDDEDYIAEIYNMHVLPYQGFYIGFPTIFNPIGAVPPPETNYTRINQVELAVARDIRGPWQRVADRSLFLELEPWSDENWGCSQILVAGAVMREDKHEVWIYYNALKQPSKLDDYRKFNQTDELHRLSVDPVKFEEQGGALSLAKLPIDRFVSVDAGMAGQLLTRAFEWNGEDLYINADSKWGEIYVEIVDADSRRPFPGFWVPSETPPPYVGDSTRAKVEWKVKHDLVFEAPVRLKFYLHRARLFSWWLEKRS